MVLARVDSPCIGICSTVYGDTICRGCKRDYKEVIDWNRYTPAQQLVIHQRLEQQLETVTARFIIVEDAVLLKAKLQAITSRPLLYTSPLYWAYELLRLKARQIDSLASYGLGAQPAFATLTANALFTLLDDQLYALAQQA